MALGWIIDPGSAQFDLNDLSTTFMVGQSLPMPQPRAQYVSAVDVDGDSLYSQNYGNRQITLTCEVKGASASAVETTLGYLHQKVAAINREAVSSRTGVGGALQYTSPSGKTATFDVCSVSVSPDLSATYFLGNLVQVTLTFDCLPFWRGAEVTSLSTHTEMTLPCVVFTETGITGDAPADGRLVITEAQGADQWWLTWGIQSRYYDSSADAALFYEAEGRTPLTGATVATHSGASGGASNNTVRSAALTTSYGAILSTQAASAGNHLSHVGDFRVYARVICNNANQGTISLALDWVQGDFARSTRNTAATIAAHADQVYRLLDLGLVSLSAAAQGTQRWEGRLVAKSTNAGDTIDVDCLMLVPVAEGSGIVEAVFNTEPASAFAGHDTFTGSSGNLTAHTADTGGAWTGAGATSDFTTSGAGLLTRTAVSDSDFRFDTLGSAMTDAAVALDIKYANASVDYSGVLLRYVDTSNHVRVEFDPLSPAVFFKVVVAGTPTDIAAILPDLTATTGVFYRVEAYAFANGEVTVRLLDAAGNELGIKRGSHSALATGGTLASGKCGIFDYHTTSTASTRTYDNYAAWVPVGDAAVFASKQLEIRHNRAIRQDSTGSVWAAPSGYQGDYLRIPPAGREGRTVRIIAKGCRNDPATADSSVDDISAQLIYTPRGLSLPE